MFQYVKESIEDARQALSDAKQEIKEITDFLSDVLHWPIIAGQIIAVIMLASFIFMYATEDPGIWNDPVVFIFAGVQFLLAAAVTKTVRR